MALRSKVNIGVRVMLLSQQFSQVSIGELDTLPPSKLLPLSRLVGTLLLQNPVLNHYSTTAEVMKQGGVMGKKCVNVNPCNLQVVVFQHLVNGLAMAAFSFGVDSSIVHGNVGSMLRKVCEQVCDHVYAFCGIIFSASPNKPRQP